LVPMRRIHAAALSIAMWTFVAMPALCVAGAVEHACNCGLDSHCEHESQCESDPCSQVVVRKDDAPSPATHPAPAYFVVLPADVEAATPSAVVNPCAPRCSDQPSRRTFPAVFAQTILLL
jgi:hypothetical protein